MDDANDNLVELQTEDALDHCCGSIDEVVMRYTKCPLCASHLHFTHSTDFSRNVTMETSKCPECGIRVRKLMHRLQ